MREHREDKEVNDQGSSYDWVAHYREALEKGAYEVSVDDWLEPSQAEKMRHFS